VIPSGEQIVLEHETQRVVVVEVGGGLRRYAVGDWDVLDGYAEDARCTSARGQPLIPWPNRLRDGAYRFDGTEHQLALSEPEKHNAIHGLVRWANWTDGDQAADRVTMRHVLHPQSGWPFALEMAIEYVLGSEGLSVRTTATNAGDAPCPAGAGMHPYLSVGTDTIDAATLRAPGRRHLPTDAQSIPTGEAPLVDGTPYDFRTERRIADTQLDTGYGDLDRDPDGLARVELAAEGRCASLWMDAGYRYLMLFTGDSLPQPDRRRRGLGVEPMTCAPNALASGDGLVVLAPGETLVATWGLQPTP